MSIKRITISVPEELAEKIKKAAGDRAVSAWVTDLIEQELDEERLDRLWKEWVAEVDITPEAHAWAQRVIDSAISAGGESPNDPRESNAA